MGGWLWLVVACSGDKDPQTPLTEGTPSGDTSPPDTGCVAFVDGDGDGFGDPVRKTSCDDPTAVPDSTDCDDLAAEKNPEEAERCDGVDNDCDPATGEGGVVTRTDPSGLSFDVTPLFVAGTPLNPAVIDLEDGRYDLCDGTWYARLQAAQIAATLEGHGNAVLDGGGHGTVIAVDGGALTLTAMIVTHGEGSVLASNGAGLSGGGLVCIGGAEVTIDGCTFEDNGAEIGGGWFIDGCTATATATALAGNGALYGGGIYAFSGAISLTNSTVSTNTAINSGGGIGLEGDSARPSLTLIDTSVTDNEAAYGGGLVLYENASASCASTDGSEGGFLRNAASVIGGGIYLTGADYSPSMTSSSCDFGTADNDNLPTDVAASYVSELSYGYEDDASFVCDQNGCL